MAESQPELEPLDSSTNHRMLACINYLLYVHSLLAEALKANQSLGLQRVLESNTVRRKVMRCLSVEPGLVQTSHVLTYLNRSLHKVGTQSTPFYRGPKLEQKMNHGARTE